MVRMTGREIAEIVGGSIVAGPADGVACGVCTDTRELRPGQLFVALRGEQFDGNLFADEAIARGAGGVVVSVWAARDPGAAFVIVVEDTLAALGLLGSANRLRYDLPVVAITGSVGKTTTKMMLASILDRVMPYAVAPENWNNEIGVPKTLLAIDETHRAAVLELAMRGIGEIRQLARISHPTIGVITNIGLSHVERTGSIEATALAKAELLEEMSADGIAVLPDDDPQCGFLRSRCRSRAIGFGRTEGADVRATAVVAGSDGTRFSLHVSGVAQTVRASWVGMHLVDCAAAAAAAALCLGVPGDAIAAGIESFQPVAMRMRVLRLPSGAVVIDDCYNASPASVAAAIELLVSFNGRRKIAVLGSMFELGEYSRPEHLRIGEMVGRVGVDILVAVGDDGALFAEGAAPHLAADRRRVLSSNAEIIEYLSDTVEDGDVVLVKGSRAMKMEEIVEALAAEGPR
jgi:UDP-N-acetylmuramoyl-tripeptide--D-alanyl-D-alanine ligase